MQPRSVLVTGAACGIGRATVETFGAAGWQVAAPAPLLMRLRKFLPEAMFLVLIRRRYEIGP